MRAMGTELGVPVEATQLRPGDLVLWLESTSLVVRTVPAADEVMLELWTRGAVEHHVVFVPSGHPIVKVDPA